MHKDQLTYSSLDLLSARADYFAVSTKLPLSHSPDGLVITANTDKETSTNHPWTCTKIKNIKLNKLDLLSARADYFAVSTKLPLSHSPDGLVITANTDKETSTNHLWTCTKIKTILT